ncbi:hypothetical protein [Tritonibacter mobilis]|uniref:hypothetical protein n=1 Tax=Tritonibacter mobilis TaxID=379347 RepID=UPI000806E51F|nr:hypothetical protein [Tritonibacter mobilis]
MAFENLDLVNSDYVFKVSSGAPIIVEEKAKGGAGKCHFNSPQEALFIKAKDQAPVVWSLKNRKCAEAAFCLARADGSTTLHIVEMKSSLSLKTFLHVMEQIRGMYLSALATLSITKTAEPSEVTAYLAYNEDKISHGTGESLILSKTLVGGEELPGKREWRKKEIPLPHSKQAKLIIGKRSKGDVTFGEVS